MYRKTSIHCNIFSSNISMSAHMSFIPKSKNDYMLSSRCGDVLAVGHTRCLFKTWLPGHLSLVISKSIKIFSVDSRVLEECRLSAWIAGLMINRSSKDGYQSSSSGTSIGAATRRLALDQAVSWDLLYRRPDQKDGGGGGWRRRSGALCRFSRRFWCNLEFHEFL